MINIAINGYGRIGRNILRALYESTLRDHMRIVAINDLGGIDSLAHLTRYDSTHGRFAGTVAVDDDHLLINGDRIRVLSVRDPKQLPWRALQIDVVHEATGLFASREKASWHLAAGAKKVLISAPASDAVDATIVYGVNHDTLQPDHQIVSNASCTTNGVAPICKILHEAIGIESGLMTTVHSYTNDQVLNDLYHSDLRRARSAALSMIPTKTGAMAAVGLVLPALQGRLDGYAVRVPTVNVSMIDFAVLTSRETSAMEINQLFKEAAQKPNTVFQYNEEPLVSIDFNHHPASAIVDAAFTRVVSGRMAKIVAWYDNEWGFSNRMLDTTLAMMTIS